MAPRFTHVCANCRLGDDVLVPDIAGWRRERMPTLPETAWFEVAPDWVCEVLSPSTTRDDRVVKMPIYARVEVGHIWLIDPDLRMLEAHRDNTRVSPPPFGAVEIDLAGLRA